MKKVRFAFYLAKFEWRNLFKKDKKLHVVDDGISCWTWLFNWGTPGVSHWEGWIEDVECGFGQHTLWISDKLRMDLEKRVCLDSFIDDKGIHGWYSESYEKEKQRTLYTENIYGTCYTSTMRGKDNGTVSRPASEVFTNPERWLILKFEVTDESFKTAVLWADLRVLRNKGYSMKDIRRFFMPLWLLKKLRWDDPEREICSEHGEGWAIRLHPVEHLTIGWGLLCKILIRSPRRLWRDLVRRHHVATFSLATGLMVYDSKGKRVK